MKRTLTSIIFTVLCAILFLQASTVVMAQSEQAPQKQSTNLSNSPQSNICGNNKTFSFGTGQTYFRFCLSDSGNIVDIQSPRAASRYTHLFLEGYVVCGAGINSAYDAGVNASGWNTPITSQPGGANTLPLTITRTSTDGKWRLAQLFDWNTDEKEIVVTMTLKNLSGASVTSVRLARYFDGDIDDDYNDDIYDLASNSVSGRDSGTGAGHHGLMLTALSFATPHTTVVETYPDFYAHRTGCVTTAQSVPSLPPGDFSGRVTYNLGAIGPRVSKTARFIYRRF